MHGWMCASTAGLVSDCSSCPGTSRLQPIPSSAIFPPLIFSLAFFLLLSFFLVSLSLFFALCPGASREIPAQWGPYNWKPCLLFSPLPSDHWYAAAERRGDRGRGRERESSSLQKAGAWAGQFVASFFFFPSYKRYTLDGIFPTPPAFTANSQL